MSDGVPGWEFMTLHGWVALGLGVVFTAALAGGLMWLMFHSARKGWDDLDREP